MGNATDQLSHSTTNTMGGGGGGGWVPRQTDDRHSENCAFGILMEFEEWNGSGMDFGVSLVL